MELYGSLFWVLCGVASYAVASNKGNSGCAWFFIGLLLGPFGLLFAFLNPKNEKNIEKKLIKKGDMQRCPFCAELIKAEAILCHFCNKPLNDESHFNRQGILYYKDKKFNDAISMFDRVIEINAKNINAFYNRGISKRQIGDSNGSKADLITAAHLGHTGAADFLKKHNIKF